MGKTASKARPKTASWAASLTSAVRSAARTWTRLATSTRPTARTASSTSLVDTGRPAARNRPATAWAGATASAMDAGGTPAYPEPSDSLREVSRWI
jgi:hypothetical protein